MVAGHFLCVPATRPADKRASARDPAHDLIEADSRLFKIPIQMAAGGLDFFAGDIKLVINRNFLLGCPDEQSPLQGTANKTRPSSVFGINIASSLGITSSGRKNVNALAKPHALGHGAVAIVADRVGKGPRGVYEFRAPKTSCAELVLTETPDIALAGAQTP